MLDQQPEVLKTLADERATLAATAQAFSSGRAFARAWTAAVDRAVAALLPADKSGGWAVLALGGYARQDLSPHSDVDLVVVCARHDTAVEQVANDLFYALWDAGLHLLPAVRTPAEASRQAAGDLATLTAGLETRLLGGSPSLHAEYARAIMAHARAGGARPFLRTLLADVRRRQARAESAAHGLEPDLKTGRGGLRDAQALRWAGLVLLNAPEPRDQATAGYLDDEEASTLDDAVDFLLRVRHHLHLLTNHKTDRLVYEYQTDVALRLGYQPLEGHSPAERLMREVQARADGVARAAAGFWERIEDRLLVRPSPVGPLLRAVPARWNGARAREGREAGSREGRLRLPDGELAPTEPPAALALFAMAARRGLPLAHATVRAIRQALPPAVTPTPWPVAEREAFLTVLRAGEAAPALLDQMAACRLLGHYLPEWEAVRFLARQDPLHRYTIDRHSAQTVAELGLLTVGGRAPYALTNGERDLLLLAGLLHDLGKAKEGDHSQIGERLARAICLRMGMGTDDAETVAFLVREHLLLARTAGRRDLEDDSLLTGLAGRVGSLSRLHLLHLLTTADSVATGPAAWSDWKAALVAELVTRLASHLAGDDGADRPWRLAARRSALAEALAGQVDPESLAAFLDLLPETYVLATAPEAVRQHLALREAAGLAPRVAFRRPAEGPYEEFSLVAPDRPGLLWRVCGVLALHGVTIVEARVYTDREGMALDTFRVADAFEAEISVDKRAAIARDVALALEGRLAIAYRLARKLRDYARTGPSFSRPPRVTLDNFASPEFTVIEVRARDHLGLLYKLARALSDLHLDIHLAKVATRGPEAVDVFYVRDLRGGKVDTREHAREVERALVFALAESEGA